MPTEVFINLPDSKKQLLIDAAFKTFCDKPYHLVSINEISQNLGITRTAFYYYFTSKEDIYEYIIKLIKKDFLDNYVYNQDKRLNLFEIFISLFIFLSNFKNNQKQNFIIDLFYNIGYNGEAELLEEIINNGELQSFRKFKGFEEYSMNTLEEKEEVLRILLSIVYHEVIIYYLKDVDINDALASLQKKFDLIKYGIIRNEELNNA
ncbi:MAG: TetR/AcrR family transcriptional regulator [Bacilli bacterium]|nr:TetR/AcrR family transcriptional regulator [Bacilli bacterium]